MHVGRRVRGQRPGRGRPHQKGLVVAADQRKPDVQARVDDLLVALGDDLVLGQPGAAAGAPRHHVGALVDPPALVADLQEVPDCVVVLVGHRVVRVIPLHPVSQPDRLLRLFGGEPPYALLAELDEPVDAEVFNLTLVVELELLLDLDLDPQSLAVKAVLVALLETPHRLVALEHVLVCAAPGVVNPHGVVGRDGPVDEGEGPRRIVVGVEVLFEDVLLLPPLHDVPLHLDEVHPGRHRLEHRSSFLAVAAPAVGPKRRARPTEGRALARVTTLIPRRPSPRDALSGTSIPTPL